MVLTIAPTQNCNFDCTYCFEKWRTKGSMSDQTEDAIINYLEKQIAEYGLESISLTWYGGEPLLENKRIISMGTRINNLGLTFFENDIVTNGYLLNDKICSLLVDLKISNVQITLDGRKKTHDKRRPLKNGKGTFDKIIKNLDNFFNGRLNDKLYISIRVNIDGSNKMEFYEIKQWLLKRFPYENFFVYPGWVHLDEGDVKKRDCLNRNEITDFYLDIYKKEGIVYEKLFPENINIECLSRSPYSMVIGWQGEIYKCYEDVGNKDLVIGNINDPEIWTNYGYISKYAVGIDHYQNPECRKCAYLPICDGGCPIRRLENKYKGTKNDCCTRFKHREKEFLDLYYELTISRKDE